jgi:hypothetical protein
MYCTEEDLEFVVKGIHEFIVFLEEKMNTIIDGIGNVSELVAPILVQDLENIVQIRKRQFQLLEMFTQKSVSEIFKGEQQ